MFAAQTCEVDATLTLPDIVIDLKCSVVTNLPKLVKLFMNSFVECETAWVPN
jgi:hypothetical protein